MTSAEVIDYWCSDRMRDHWFSSAPELDAEILEKSKKTREKAVEGELEWWRNTALGSLALILIFDQFPLNMFRGEIASFQTEENAIAVAIADIDNNLVQEFSGEQLASLFMPYMHSEKMENQDLEVELFRKYDLERNFKFARHHGDNISRFGRFPHRNEILGRKSSVEELGYLRAKGAFKG